MHGEPSPEGSAYFAAIEAGHDVRRSAVRGRRTTLQIVRLHSNIAVGQDDDVMSTNRGCMLTRLETFRLDAVLAVVDHKLDVAIGKLRSQFRENRG